jgi:hypothetical protein
MADQEPTTTSQSEAPQGETTAPTEGDKAKPQPSEIDQLKERLAAAEARADAARKDSEGAQAYLQNLLGTLRTAAERPSSSEAEPPRDLRERITEDPEGVLDEHFRTRMGPLYNAYLQNQDLQNRELARERIYRDDNLKDENGVSFWDKYEREIDSFMTGMPAEVKARPGAYERALKFVLAQHLDEVVDSRAAKLARVREARERGAFTEGPTGAAPRGKQPETLSPLEKEVAKGLGMTEQQFLDAKRMDQFGGTGGT